MTIGHLVPEALRERFERKIDLPTLPEVIRRVLGLLSGDQVALQPVINLVRRDAVLSGRIVQLANTAAFSARSFGTDVDQAIILIGTARLRMLVTAVGAISACAHLTPRFSLWSYWVAAATRAALAQQLATRLDESPDRAFSIGLTSGIGQLIIGHVVPDLQERILAQSRRSKQSYHDSASAVGLDEAAIGAWLLTSWGLEREIITGVAEQWHPVTQVSRVTAIGQLANVIADAGSTTRMPGDCGDADPSLARHLIAYLQPPADLDLIRLRDESYEQARALVDCARR
jgi:HD-like signal output (HDOD) protein